LNYTLKPKGCAEASVNCYGVAGNKKAIAKMAFCGAILLTSKLLHVESKVHHIAILHDIFFTL
jgi:hypothetical protein